MTHRAALGVGAAALLAQPRPATPAPGSAEVHFVQGMAVHHAQATQMSALVLQAAQDRPARSLALDIQLRQEEQGRQRAAWRRHWEAPEGRMPGSAETLFLRLIRRRQEALTMAASLRDRAPTRRSGCWRGRCWPRRPGKSVR
ncbi:DUF305 domain-containing protein [Deinococcus taeanensis]|uniref:DUF305 domain-containing protein n=1 Tax=Deinococcus taeanensis TaxID=2737050 RepID=UPI001CDB6CEB|nr:DUF305 domain-containing protein [Deinococcus taeanensis]